MMTCPKCGGKAKTYRTLQSKENETYRKKKCEDCSHIFFTIEYSIEDTPSLRREWDDMLRDTYKKKEKK